MTIIQVVKCDMHAKSKELIIPEKDDPYDVNPIRRVVTEFCYCWKRKRCYKCGRFMAVDSYYGFCNTCLSNKSAWWDRFWITQLTTHH